MYVTIKYHPTIHQFIHYLYCLSLEGRGGAGADPSWNWTRGRVHPGQVSSQSQGYQISYMYNISNKGLALNHYVKCCFSRSQRWRKTECVSFSGNWVAFSFVLDILWWFKRIHFPLNGTTKVKYIVIDDDQKVERFNFDVFKFANFVSKAWRRRQEGLLISIYSDFSCILKQLCC